MSEYDRLYAATRIKIPVAVKKPFVKAVVPEAIRKITQSDIDKAAADFRESKEQPK